MSKQETAYENSSAADEALIMRVAAGDVEAFEILVRRYQIPALRFAQRFIGNASEAEELAQEAFLQLYRCASQYRQGASFKTWFFTILSNLCRNLLKRRKFIIAEKPSVEPSAPEDLTAALNLKEQRRALTHAIRVLPTQQRLALLLCHYEECSYAEIAAILKLSVKAVESLLVRAKRNLRRELVGERKKSVV